MMKSATPIRELTAAARAGLFRSWGRSIGVMLVYMLLLTGLALVPVAGGILQLIFAAPLMAGLYLYFLQTVRKQDHPFSMLFSGFDRFGAAWRSRMLALLIILGWSLLLMLPVVLVTRFVRPDASVFPAYTFSALVAVAVLLASCGLIILQMRYYLVLYVVADDPMVQARQAVGRSAELMSGNYGRLALLWLRFIGWQILCALTLGIGLLWLGPYMAAAHAAFYDDLSRTRCLKNK